MSMTIVVSMVDEEHILTIHPGDNFIDILENILGDTNNCIFSLNNEQLTSVNDLSKKLANNIKIEVRRYRYRGALVSSGLRGLPWVLKSEKNPCRPIIPIETVHISCSSDSYDENEDMAGLIVYAFNNEQKFELNGHRCRTGYILIKATKNLMKITSDHGIVHGKLFKWFFGIEPDHRFVGAGFSLHEKKIKFNSGVFNARNDDYHDGLKSMSQNEIYIIKYAINELFKNMKWKINSTLSLSTLDKNHYHPGEELPIQNYPKTSSNEDLR